MSSLTQRRLGLVSGFVLWALVWPSSMRAQSDSQIAERVSRLLAEARPESSKEVANRLKLLGRDARPALIDALLTCLSESGDPAIRALLSNVLDDEPIDGFLDAILAGVRRRPDLARRLAAVEVIALRGRAAGYPYLDRVLEGLPDPLRTGPNVAAAFANAVRHLMEVDEHGMISAVRAGIGSTPSALRRSVLMTLASRPRSETVRVLFEILATTHDASAVVPALGSLPLALLPSDAREWHPVLDLVEQADLNGKVLIWSLTGRLAVASPDALIVDLVDPEPRVRRAALEALRRMSQQRFAGSPGRWHKWWNDERTLWVERWPAWETDLESDDVGTVLRALQALERHLIVGRDARPHIGRLIHHESPSVRLQAIGTLRRASAAEFSEALLEAIQDPEPAVASAARQALGEFFHPLPFIDADSVRELLR